MPKNHAEWRAAKLERNRERDLLVTRTLRKSGGHVVRVYGNAILLANTGRASLSGLLVR